MEAGQDKAEQNGGDGDEPEKVVFGCGLATDVRAHGDWKRSTGAVAM
jgi:hypothetical protein